MGKLFLNQMEIDITNKCNLNCANCTHFSPLTKDVFYYSLEDFKKDITRLFELFVIDKIKLVGGEPFLHPKLCELVDSIHEISPLTKIQIFTNGILVKEIKELKSYVSKKHYDVFIVQSKFPNISELSSAAIKDKSHFKNINLNLKGESNKEDAKLCCFSKNCISLANGRLYVCPIARNIKQFTEYFNLPLDLDENSYSISIYENSAAVILAFLLDFDKGLDFCRFCNVYHPSTSWKKSKKEMSEWVFEND